jgi:hypothetical protein
MVHFITKLNLALLLGQPIVKWMFPVYREKNFTKINLKYSIMLEEWKYVER